MTNPKHTDTSRSGDLVERLRKGVLYGDARLHNPKGHDPLRMEAADRIEALEAENERLREGLREYVYETTHLSPQENDGSHWCKISANCLNNARAALGEKP